MQAEAAAAAAERALAEAAWKQQVEELGEQLRVAREEARATTSKHTEQLLRARLELEQVERREAWGTE